MLTIAASRGPALAPVRARMGHFGHADGWPVLWGAGICTVTVRGLSVGWFVVLRLVLPPARSAPLDERRRTVLYHSLI